MRQRKIGAAALLLFPAWALAAGWAGAAAEERLIDDGESPGAWRPASGLPTPELARVEGRPGQGGALHVSLFKSEKPAFVGRPILPGQDSPPAAGWDRAAGFSFRFKGDGSAGFVSVVLIDESFTKRYAALVGLRPAEWRQVSLRWGDCVPEDAASGWLGAADAGMKPSGVRAIWFGRGAHLRPWNACAFEIDDLRLEPALEAPVPPLPSEAGLPHTRAKLKVHQALTLVALGDSITFGAALEEREKNAYPALLQELLRRKFGGVGVTVVNRGIGGLETRQGVFLIPRDAAAFAPDLVTVHFGYNDFTAWEDRRVADAERRTLAAENFRQYVTRIRAATGGTAEVLLIATLPGADEPRRHALDFLGEEMRRVAGELRCAYTEAPRAAFQEALAAGKLETLFARLPGGELDAAHPNAAGHKLFAEALLKAFE